MGGGSLQKSNGETQPVKPACLLVGPLMMVRLLTAASSALAEDSWDLPLTGCSDGPWELAGGELSSCWLLAATVATGSSVFLRRMAKSEFLCISC